MVFMTKSELLQTYAYICLVTSGQGGEKPGDIAEALQLQVDTTEQIELDKKKKRKLSKSEEDHDLTPSEVQAIQKEFFWPADFLKESRDVKDITKEFVTTTLSKVKGTATDNIKHDRFYWLYETTILDLQDNDLARSVLFESLLHSMRAVDGISKYRGKFEKVVKEPESHKKSIIDDLQRQMLGLKDLVVEPPEVSQKKGSKKPKSIEQAKVDPNEDVIRTTWFNWKAVASQVHHYTSQRDSIPNMLRASREILTKEQKLCHTAVNDFLRYAAEVVTLMCDLPSSLMSNAVYVRQARKIREKVNKTAEVVSDFNDLVNRSDQWQTADALLAKAEKKYER